MSTRRRIIATVGALVVAAFASAFVAGNVGFVKQLVAGATSIDPRVAVLGIACSGLAIANRGALNRCAHRAVGLDVGVGAMTHTAAVGFAAQKLVRSAGAVGLAVFVRHGRRRGHASGPVAAACLLTAGASFAALGILLGLVVAVLAVGDRLTGWWIAAAIGFTLYSTLVALVVVVVVRSRRVAMSSWALGQRMRRRMRRRRTTDRADAAFPTELFDAIGAARARRDVMGHLVFHAVVSKLLGAMMLAAAILSVGLPVGANEALVIYATALAASMLTIVPGGVGTVEVSTAALLMAAGASAGAAAVAVALFRLFDLWLPLLTGLVLARGELERPDPVQQVPPVSETTLSPVAGAIAI